MKVEQEPAHFREIIITIQNKKDYEALCHVFALASLSVKLKGQPDSEYEEIRWILQDYFPEAL